MATILAASAVIFAEPVFAQVSGGSHPDDPEPSGSPIISNPSPTNSGDASNYSFDDPRWVALPSYDDPYESYSLRLLNRNALHPAATPRLPAENLPGSTFGLQPPVGLVDPFGLSPVNPATVPELMLPDTMGRPADALETPVR